MRLRKWGFLAWVALSAIFLDQVSKAIIVHNLQPNEQWMPIEAIRPYFTLTYVTNTGAAFGMLPEGGTLFTIVALVVVGVILYFYRQLPERVWLVRVALGLQLGGAVGNLVDRIRLGYVVDFLDFKFWPVFNVADSCIVVGVALLIFLMWREDRRTASRKRQEQSPANPRTPEDEPSSAG